jgi:hypothetical protein
MWCDNCLLLLPLRGGAIIWAAVIFLYSLVGALILFIYGKFLYFVAPEWYIYGGIAMAVAGVALVNLLALSNRSYIWIRVCKFLWPFVIIICAIRATIMILELQRGKDKITWECENGGQIWPSNAVYDLTGATLPATFCSPGQASLLGALIICLLGDLVFQIYMFFLTWRYQKRLEHYDSMKGPFEGGVYS